MRCILPALALALSTALPGHADVLHVYNWFDYIDPSIITDFEQETGIAVVYDTFEDAEAVEVLLMTGGSGYDLVLAPSAHLGRLIAGGMLSPLDKGALQNLGNLWPEVMRRIEPLDPGAEYAIPYLWGTVGLAYDRAAITARMPDAPFDSWAMLFDPEVVARFADCGVTIIDSPEEVLGAVLAWLGRDPNSSDLEDINDAFEALRRVVPHVLGFNIDQIGDLSNGQACLALTWSGDALMAADRAKAGVEVTYSPPPEGAAISVDFFVVPADAPNPAAAHRFLDFLLRPEVVARCTDVTWYANANAEATALVDPEVRGHSAVYPGPEAMAHLFALTARSPEDKRMIARAWSRLKLGL